MENADFGDTFWGVITKLDYFLGSFLCVYRSFLSSMYKQGYFCGLPICCCFFLGGWGVGVGVNSRSLV